MTTTVAPQVTTLVDLYQATATPRIVEVPSIPFLMIDGAGDPNVAIEYRDAISALYSLAYTLKFSVKKMFSFDYHVFPLEGLWWTEDMAAFSVARKSDWSWTMMIAQPEPVTVEVVDAAAAQLRTRKSLPALERVRFSQFAEGRAAQVLHRGPYADEGPTVERLHRFIREQGGTFDGRQQKHHEIYLSDPGRTAPERLRTIVRQAFV
jgi:hypothetical protein